VESFLETPEAVGLEMRGFFVAAGIDHLFIEIARA